MADDPYIQCQKCYKWRPLPKGTSATVSLNDSPWECSMSTVEKIECFTPENADLVHTSRLIKRREEKKSKKRKRSKSADLTGSDIVGHRAKSFWDLPDGSKWQYGVIDDYDEETDEYKISYDNGSFVWAKKPTFELAENPDDESDDDSSSSSSSEPPSDDEGTPGKKKKKAKKGKKDKKKDKKDKKHRKKRRKTSKGGEDIKAEVVETAIVFDLNEESHENQSAIVRQKHLNTAMQNLETFYAKMKELVTPEGEVPLEKFDDQKLYKVGKQLRNEMNFVLSPFEGNTDD